MNSFSKLTPHIRWVIRRDMPEVLAIENSSFEFPWSEDEWIEVLRQRNNIAMCAEVNERVVGVMAYGLHRDKIHLLNFAVHPDYRRRGVGTAMVAKLVGKLTRERRNQLTLEVRETNLEAQQFFRAVGFKAAAVLREFEATGEDAYRMCYRYSEVFA